MATLILTLPLFGALFSLMFNKSFFGTRGVCFFLLTNMLVTTVLSYWILLDKVLKNSISENIFTTEWFGFVAGAFNWGFTYDITTALMVSTVCTVSTLVHLYSLYYMETDPSLRRFITYLSLFTFFMLLLIGSNNLLQLFFAWEGVGLCSYLLINFWFTRLQANKAALKAMLMNRIGDAGLLLAITLIVTQYGNIRYEDLFTGLAFSNFDYVWPSIGVTSVDLICFFLFVGIMAKSAQIGLHTWLPDAMEGPTPVSALIHAATMVTAGIYLMIRMSPFFECSPKMLTFALVVGGLTAIFGATTALAQTDLKKIIAYSTCSQLGYMVVACGTAQFKLALFHLINHAFFKALLFLGAGAVIHIFAGQQDIRKMGALRNIFPIGFITMSLASAALAGLPFFSGFYSKEAILASLSLQGTTAGLCTWFVGLLTATCTSLYSAALIYYIYLGSPRGSLAQYRTLHSVDWRGSTPLIVLGALSVTSGYLLKDLLIGPAQESYYSLSSLQLFLADPFILDLGEWLPLSMKLGILAVGASGFIYYLFATTVGTWQIFFVSWLTTYKFFFYRWYWDQIYNSFITAPLYTYAYTLVYSTLEKGFIELVFIQTPVRGSFAAGFTISRFQTGEIGRYLAFTMLGFVCSWEFSKYVLFSYYG